jgi:hypothetical protein
MKPDELRSFIMLVRHDHTRTTYSIDFALEQTPTKRKYASYRDTLLMYKSAINSEMSELVSRSYNIYKKNMENTSQSRE